MTSAYSNQIIKSDGIGVGSLSSKVGHSSISTTAEYAEDNPVLLGKISEGLSI